MDCVPACPVPGAITGEKDKRHVIDKEKCIGCGICLDKCEPHAISLWGATSKHKISSRDKA